MEVAPGAAPFRSPRAGTYSRAGREAGDVAGASGSNQGRRGESEREAVGLVDRTIERAAVEETLHRAAVGGSGALLLRGEPGVGKTTLLEHARGQSDGFRDLAGRGVESEADLPFAGLYAVLNGLIGEHIDDLPQPQAHAPAAALGLEEGHQPDRFSVAAATLWLLAHATEDRPVLVVVDDLQWLDPASTEALLFAARRLESDAVALLFAARRGEGCPVSGEGLAQIEVQGLGRSDALALLTQHHGSNLASPAAEREVELSSGNPLAPLELAAAPTPRQREGPEAIEEPPPVGPRLERANRGRLFALPEESRRAPVVAASETSQLLELHAALLD